MKFTFGACCAAESQVLLEERNFGVFLSLSCFVSERRVRLSFSEGNVYVLLQTFLDLDLEKFGDKFPYIERVGTLIH